MFGLKTKPLFYGLRQASVYRERMLPSLLLGKELFLDVVLLPMFMSLYLGSCYEGKVFTNISKLYNLKKLDLSYNNINGEITGLIEGFSKCINNKLDGGSCRQSLVYLDMSYNNLSGRILESFRQLSALEWLYMSSNSLTGYLTEGHFSNLRRLKYLDLSFNSLNMTLISNSWIPPFNATSIMMCSCYVGSNFPAWLQTQINLKRLCLSEAGISDKIPPWLWNRDISILNLSNNCIQGQLPSSQGKYSYGILDLSSNCFSGPIPNLKFGFIFLSNNSFSSSSHIGETNPVVLSLSDNHINGSIPRSLCNWTSLEVLDLSNNELTGGFPECWSKSQLGSFDVPKNKRAEDSFSTMAHPMKLQYLHMSNNSLSGQFPSFLRFCKGLVVLDLGENRFSGNIPTWIGENLLSLKVLHLRSNSFDGNIPVQISSLSSLHVLDLACNNFSGYLSSSFGNFTSMVEKLEGIELWSSFFTATSYYKESLLLVVKGLSLEYYTSVLLLVTSIDLSNNNLSGGIPNEVTKLHELHFLNLSENHFIGNIPQNIGDIKVLESLDLSMNNLFGQIPETMAALNFLSRLNLSYNNLSGSIPSGYQMQTFDDTSYIGNHNLCGRPLPKCPKNAPPHQEEEQTDEDGYEMIWIYVISTLGFIMGFWGFIGTVMIKKDIRISYLRFIDRIYDWIYVELSIKFAKLKSIKGTGKHRH